VASVAERTFAFFRKLKRTYRIPPRIERERFCHRTLGLIAPLTGSREAPNLLEPLTGRMQAARSALKRPQSAVSYVRRCTAHCDFERANLCGALGGPSPQLGAVSSSVESDISGKNSKETALDSTIRSSQLPRHLWRWCARRTVNNARNQPRGFSFAARDADALEKCACGIYPLPSLGLTMAT
jgi:hypothetical protein